MTTGKIELIWYQSWKKFSEKGNNLLHGFTISSLLLECTCHSHYIIHLIIFFIHDIFYKIFFYELEKFFISEKIFSQKTPEMPF